MLKLIPSGFPVRIDVPLFYVLTARVTFQNINSLDGDGCSEGTSNLYEEVALHCLDSTDSSDAVLPVTNH